MDTLDSFRAMRLLRIHNDVVQFQQTSYLHLFAAKAAISDPAFLSEIFKGSDLFRADSCHYAALVRNSEQVVLSMTGLLQAWTIDEPEGLNLQ